MDETESAGADRRNDLLSPLNLSEKKSLPEKKSKQPKRQPFSKVPSHQSHQGYN